MLLASLAVIAYAVIADIIGHIYNHNDNYYILPDSADVCWRGWLQEAGSAGDFNPWNLISTYIRVNAIAAGVPLSGILTVGVYIITFWRVVPAAAFHR